MDKTNRPLNRYVANALNVFHCPADHGDADVKSCWDAYGISYYMVFWFDNLGVRHVGGAAEWPWPLPGNLGPIESAEIARAPATKLILGDFPWYARNINDFASAWDNDRGKPLFPTYLAMAMKPTFFSRPLHRRRRTREMHIGSKLIECCSKN